MGAEFPPVVRGNARFSGSREHLHVNVWFRNKNELQGLIDALIELRDSDGDRSDHFHLQHYDLIAGGEAGLAEVNFFRPGRNANELDIDLINTAAAYLAQQG
jgi:hypothetical protein